MGSQTRLWTPALKVRLPFFGLLERLLTRLIHTSSLSHVRLFAQTLIPRKRSLHQARSKSLALDSRSRGHGGSGMVVAVGGDRGRSRSHSHSSSSSSSSSSSLRTFSFFG